MAQRHLFVATYGGATYRWPSRQAKKLSAAAQCSVSWCSATPAAPTQGRLETGGLHDHDGAVAAPDFRQQAGDDVELRAASNEGAVGHDPRTYRRHPMGAGVH